MRLQNYQSCWVIHRCSMKMHCSVAGWCTGIGRNYKSTSKVGSCTGVSASAPPASLVAAWAIKVQKHQHPWLLHWWPKYKSANRAGVRKLDLSDLCFSLNFSFAYVLSQFPSMFPLLTYSQSFFSLSADYPRHSRRRRDKIRFN